MKVILTEDVASLGSIGAIVQVKNGYARNYLVPRALAVPANEGNQKELEHRQRILAAKSQRILEEIKAVAKKIEKLKLEIKKAVGEEDRIFGSVTSAEVAELIGAQGIQVSKKDVHFEEEIKKTGKYSVDIKLHSEVTAKIKIKVVAE